MLYKLRKSLVLVVTFVLWALVATPSFAQTLAVWTYAWEEEALAFLQEAADKYGQNHGLNIEVIGVTSDPNADYNEKLLIAIAGGVAPDIALIDAGVVSTNLAHSGVILPIDDFIDRSTVEDLESRFYPPAWEAFNYEGKTYGLRITSNNIAYVYNMDWLNAHGLPAPSDDWLWSDWVEYAQLLSDPDNERWGTTPADSAWTWLPFLWQNGGEFFNSDRTRALFHSQAGVEALELQVEMVHDYRAAKPLGAPGGFADERVAMAIAGPWNLRPWRDTLSFEYDFVFLPGHRERASNLGGEGFAIFSQSSHPQEAYNFIEYVTTTPEIAIGFARTWWTVPPLREAAQNPDAWPDPKLEVFVRQMEHARSRPYVPNWEQVRTIMTEAIHPALHQQIDPKSALEEAASRMNVLLDEVRK